MAIARLLLSIAGLRSREWGATVWVMSEARAHKNRSSVCEAAVRERTLA
jgi:hypothetical protein